MSADQDSLRPGEHIGDFVVESALGAGSFGITYLAQDAGLDRKVAIKEFFPSAYARRNDSGTITPNRGKSGDIFRRMLARFSEEAKILAKFRHPAIVRVNHIIPNLHSTAYIVMEYIEGETLEDWVNTRGLPSRADVVAITRQLIDGLEAVHKVDILHRDIKPSNIMLHRADGQELCPVLIDFGSSRDLALQEEGFTALVTDGYSPLEQYSRNNVQIRATDIYALACTIHFMLTGQTPPVAGARMGLVEALAPVEPQRAKLFGDRFIQAVLKGAEVRPERRPQDVASWRKMFAFEPTELREQNHQRGQGSAFNRRALLIGGGVVGALAVAGGAIALLQPSHKLTAHAHALTFGWRKPLGEMGPDPFVQIVATENGAVLAAHSFGDDGLTRMRAVRLGNDGTVLADWVDDQTDGEATAIHVAEDGGAYVGGRVGQDATLVRLGPDWRPVWRSAENPGRVTSVLERGANIVLAIEALMGAGSQLVALDAGGRLAWRIGIDKGKNETIQRMIALEKGGYAVLGWGLQTRDTPQGQLNQNYAWVALVDDQGNSRNRPQTKGLGAATGWAIAEAQGVIYVAGRTSDGGARSPSLLFMWAIDSTGAELWKRWDYQASPSSGRTLARVGDDRLYVGGWSGAEIHDRIAQIGPDGDLVWDFVQPAGTEQTGMIDLSLRLDGAGFAASTARIRSDRTQLQISRIGA